jgi:hypothetical protein
MVWWPKPVIPAAGRADIYRLCPRPARAVSTKPYLKNKFKKNKKQTGLEVQHFLATPVLPKIHR